MEPSDNENAVPAGNGRQELSEREREILVLVATGASNKLIAQQLVISPNTVKVHVRNIFGKIGVASRTEAALFAIREGLVAVPGGAPTVAPDEDAEPAGTTFGSGGAAEAEKFGPPATGAGASAGAVLARPRPARGWWVAGLLLALLLIGGTIAYPLLRPAPTATPTAVSATPRWQTRAGLLTGRSGLAVTTYADQVYAIGGETETGVTGLAERYDPAADSWTALAEKPVAVTDVGAAVIGGKIYVPGGRMASGAVTEVMEVYDPRLDAWETRASLPQALSAYALAAFEGRLYLFGGWDGQVYVDTVYEYDPGQDEWTERSPLLAARGFAGAAVANGKIYVLGGTDARGPLALNDEYSPEQDVVGGTAWQSRAPLPQARWRMGVVSVANIVHIVGGEGGAEALAPLEYFPQSNEWKSFDAPPGPAWSRLGLTVVETVLHAVGGTVAATPSAAHQSYQAIYTVAIPIVP